MAGALRVTGSGGTSSGVGGSGVGVGGVGRSGAGGGDHQVGDDIERELARLAALLHRHFGGSRADSLLPALANPRDAEGARVFLDQIRDLANTLGAEARRQDGSDPAAGAIGDLRRELLALIDRFEERVGVSGK